MLKWNSALRNGTYKDESEKDERAGYTHHIAGFGVRRMAKMLRDQDRFVTINATLAITSVVNVKARASASPCPR